MTHSLFSILKDPKKEQFRMLKKSNPKIQKTLMSLSGGIHDLIIALGYTDVTPFHCHKELSTLVRRRLLHICWWIFESTQTRTGHDSISSDESEGEVHVSRRTQEVWSVGVAETDLPRGVKEETREDEESAGYVQVWQSREEVWCRQRLQSKWT